MTTDPGFLQRVAWFLNLAENDSGKKETDYAAVYRYFDGHQQRRQVTLGRGFTEDGGNLRKVVDAYLADGGQSTVLRDRVGQIGKGTLVGDRAFIQALQAAGQEPAMRAAQDAVFQAAYLDPALRWAAAAGLREPTSVAVVIDSFLHSGRMPGWLMDRFTERTPANGGTEKRWVFAYLVERWKWFRRARGPLHTCVFRPKFFLSLVANYTGGGWSLNAQGNWGFAAPLNLPEKGPLC